VLGFDTPRSMDHDWGPQLALFLSEPDYSTDLADEIQRVMGDELPFEVAGISTHFEPFPDLGLSPDGQLLHGGHMATKNQRPIRHKVRVLTVRRLPPHMGSTTQWVDSTDVQTYPRWFAPLRALYTASP
jgi:hypothetical protein